MKLFEILDTLPDDISWTIENGFQHRGSFSINEQHCVVQLDEYEVLGKTLIDFGFVVDGSIQAKETSKPSSKVIGAVYNVAKTKLQELSFDLILISVVKGSGLEESRKSLYSSLARLFQRSLRLMFDSDWVENSNGFYRIWSTKETITKEELDIFIKEVSSK